MPGLPLYFWAVLLLDDCGSDPGADRVPADASLASEAGVFGGEDEPLASDWTAVTRAALSRTAGEIHRSGPAGSVCASSSSDAGAFTTALRSGAGLLVYKGREGSAELANLGRPTAFQR
jgi:hypothetical protein